jgi:hypothetical protein
MSEVGSQSSLYDELHDCAELVDGALTDLMDGVSPDSSSSRRELGTLLVGLGNRNWFHTSSRALAVLLGLFKTSDRQTWSDLGTTLLTDSANDRSVAKLEKLALLLEQEQQTVMARIQQL